TAPRARRTPGKIHRPENSVGCLPGLRVKTEESRKKCREESGRLETGAVSESVLLASLPMPIRERIWAGLLVSYALSGATACSDDKEQAAKLAEVQRIADEKLKKAEA